MKIIPTMNRDIDTGPVRDNIGALCVESLQLVRIENRFVEDFDVYNLSSDCLLQARTEELTRHSASVDVFRELCC